MRWRARPAQATSPTRCQRDVQHTHPHPCHPFRLPSPPLSYLKKLPPSGKISTKELIVSKVGARFAANPARLRQPPASGQDASGADPPGTRGADSPMRAQKGMDWIRGAANPSLAPPAARPPPAGVEHLRPQGEGHLPERQCPSPGARPGPVSPAAVAQAQGAVIAALLHVAGPAPAACLCPADQSALSLVPQSPCPPAAFRVRVNVPVPVPVPTPVQVQYVEKR